MVPVNERTVKMIELGKRQKLLVVKKVEFGIYLAEKMDASAEERILLPKSQMPAGISIGDELNVFVYKDSKDRNIATVRTPLIELGEIAKLRVAAVTKIGAFLDWGLEKELLLPFKEQTFRVREGEEVLVALYVDKTGRLCATTKLYHYLETTDVYAKDDWVEGTLYEISDSFGAFVAVDDRYQGLVPKREFTEKLEPGAHVRARVVNVTEDGKLTLSLKEKAYLQMSVDADKVMKLIESYDGVLPFNDKASPETIKRECQMSKNEFKRAVGNLLKAGRIEITPSSIKLKDRS